jgi:molybdopterin-guanine dinucleotide biosynthesis adapter protein
MKAVGFAGFSGSGKTTLVEQVLRLLRERGFSVSVIKHAHSSFDVDRPGKDSYRHREAGAFEVMLASQQRMALLREWDLSAAPKVEDLLREMQPVDWVLIEGFKHAPIPKFEVWREANKKPLRLIDDPFVIALITDSPQALPEDTRCVVLDINNPAQIADYLLTHADRFELRLEEV